MIEALRESIEVLWLMAQALGLLALVLFLVGVVYIIATNPPARKDGQKPDGDDGQNSGK